MYKYVSSLLLLVWSMAVTASNNDLWSQAATALRIGATSKASYGPPCQPGDPRSSLQTYREVCPKVSSIPDAIIDAASVPYLKRYLTEADAKEALEFWSSPSGKELLEKILREIETGVFNQLSPDDLALLEQVDNSNFGRALNKMLTDREWTFALIRVIHAYEP
jgi:hypothetical protein